MSASYPQLGHDTPPAMVFLPPEIWDCIMQFCPAESLKSLLLVSRGLSSIAVSHILSTITCVDDSGETVHDRDLDVYWTQEVRIPAHQHVLSTDPGLILRESKLSSQFSANINQILNKPAWIRHIKTVFLIWYSEKIPTTLESVIDRLSQLETLESMHLSLPMSTIPLSFDTSKVTSITTSVPGTTFGDSPDFGALLSIFEIPTLTTLYIDSMLHMDDHVPEKFHKPGCSNVTTLHFVNSGYPDENLQPLLLWPRCLKRLNMAPDMHEKSYQKRCFGEGGTHQIFEATRPLKSSLQTLAYLDWRYLCPPSDEGFADFTAMERLMITLGLIMQLDETNQSIRTYLPQGLVELHLDLDWEIEREDLSHLLPQDTGSDTIAAKAFLQWLSELVMYRADFPRLQRVVLHQDHTNNHDDDDTLQLYCPLDHEFTRQAQREFSAVGIDLAFYQGERWSRPDEHRGWSEFWNG